MIIIIILEIITKMLYKLSIPLLVLFVLKKLSYSPLPWLAVILIPVLLFIVSFVLNIILEEYIDDKTGCEQMER